MSNTASECYQLRIPMVSCTSVNFDDSIALDLASIRGLLAKAGRFSNSLVTVKVED